MSPRILGVSLCTFMVWCIPMKAVWRLRPPKTLSHACADNPADEVVTHLFDTDPPTIRTEQLRCTTR